MSGPDDTREHHARVGDLFMRVRRLPEAEREALFAVEPDESVRDEVREMLASEPDTRAGDDVLTETLRSQLLDSPLPERIGPFRILEVLGEGGMGTVHLAEQTEPVRRRVALKVIKLGMDSKEIVARFEAERQALAVMDHPGITRVLDVGATDDGRPWVAMELVKGLPLTEYCDEARLSTSERLELFRSVCQAVQHAHQKGIVHRDLKPSNILVAEHDGAPVAKVIDFGIAKALGPSLTDKTPVTRSGQAIGTPAYMSPEQGTITGLDVDTRTDVYALGVILYELLTGRRPDEITDSAEEYLSRIASGETEPPTPSAQLATLGEHDSEGIARARSTSVAALRRELRGDLDWVVLRAIEPNRNRRYPTVNALARDVARHLASEPVEARPPTATYKLRKFIGRHRAGVAAAAIIAGLLVVFSVVVGLQSLRLADERDAAEQARVEAEAARAEAVRAHGATEREAATATQVSDFLVELFEVSDPAEGRGSTVTARELLERAVEKLETDLADQPLVRARLLQVLGRVRFGLGLYPESGELIERALEIRRGELGDRHEDVAETMDWLGRVATEMSDYDRARPLLEQAIALREELLGPESPELASSLYQLGYVEGFSGDAPKARALHERALAIREKALPADDLGLGESLIALGRLDEREHEFERARDRLTRGLAIEEAARGSDHAFLAPTLAALADVHDHLREHSEARPLFERAVTLTETMFGPEHPNLAAILFRQARHFARSGENRAAVALFERSLSIRQLTLPPGHPRVAQTLGELAIPLSKLGEHERAISLTESALAIHEKTLGPGHPAVAMHLTNLAEQHVAAGDHAAACPFFERAVVVGERNAQQLSWPLLKHSRARREIEDFEAALPIAERSLEVRERQHGSDHRDVSSSLFEVALVHAGLGDLQRARTFHERALTSGERSLGPAHPLLAKLLTGYADVLLKMDEPAAARAKHERALAILDGAAGNPALRAPSLRGLAEVHRATGDTDEAERLLREALVLFEQGGDGLRKEAAKTRGLLADLLRTTGRESEAEALLAEDGRGGAR